MTKTNDDLPTWKLVPGFGGKYAATVDGKVYKVTIREGALTFWELSTRWDLLGYPHINLNGVDALKARTVAAAFGILPTVHKYKGSDPKGRANIKYRDGNKNNTRPDNLIADFDNWAAARGRRHVTKETKKE